jgi:phage gp36-like protein
MSYFTLNDILTRVSEHELVLITTDDAARTTVAATPVNDAITDAEGDIDSYLGKRYLVPLTDVPKVIVRHGVSIALHYLYGTKSTGRADQNIKDNYDAAISFLKDVSTGKAVLQGVASQQELTKSSQYRPGYISVKDRVFSRDNLSGF